VRRTLLLTNDFPPRAGGIQSYLHELARRVPPDDLVVYAPAWDGSTEFDTAQPFPVVRHPTSLMLPVPSVAARAARLVAEHRLSAVWFGAAAPLALLGPHLRGQGVQRVLACTHGHEIGWSMLPGGRRALRRIGNTADVVTFVSHYVRGRIAAAFGPRAALEHLPPGVDTSAFRPDPAARQRLRDHHGIGARPVLACISRLVRRKGQDVLIEALPQIRAAVPDVLLLLVGGGDFGSSLRDRAERLGVLDSVLLTGSVPFGDLPGYYAASDVFAMPCRTRGRGLDVEGLGIVFLEAAASGLPVVAGDSGGAPETVREGHTGTVVDGRDTEAVALACIDLLTDRRRSRGWGNAGRQWVADRWNWDSTADRLVQLLNG